MKSKEICHQKLFRREVTDDLLIGKGWEGQNVPPKISGRVKYASLYTVIAQLIIGHLLKK